MKKYFFLLATAFTLNSLAQSSLTVFNHGSGLTLAPNATVYTKSKVYDNTKVTINFQNNSSSPKTYTAKRYDVLLNTVNAETASAYFCVAGVCYGAGVTSSPDAITLAPGQKASEVSGDYQMLVADLDEVSALGLSHVKYTLSNTANAMDTIQINIKYNDPTAPQQGVGIKEIANGFTSFEVYPNPVKDNAVLKVNASRASESSLNVYNSLGKLVYEAPVFINEGKNKIDVQTADLPAGIYFVTLKTGSSSVTRKFIIN